MEKTGTTENMFYIHPDYLGSVHLVTNASGSVVQELSYDAWGRQRNATNWTYNGTLPEPKFERGYTFHEQLTEFDLINMNGRVYDPFIARFMSPDPFTQDPGNLQGYNRYSYVLNNPMKYVDPSGYTYAEFMMQNNSYEGGNFYYRGREYFYDSGSGGFYGHGGEYLGEAGYYYDYESRSYMHNGNPVNEGEAIGGSISQHGGKMDTYSGEMASNVYEFLQYGYSIAFSGSVYGNTLVAFIDPQNFTGGWNAALVGDGSYLSSVYGTFKSSRPFITGPYGPERESQSSWKNLGMRVRRLKDIENSWKGDGMPKSMKVFYGKIFPPTAVIKNGNTIIEGKDMFDRNEVSDFNRYFIAPINIVTPHLPIRGDVKLYLDIFPEFFDVDQPISPIY